MSLVKDLHAIYLARKPADLLEKHLPVTMQNGDYHWWCRDEQQLQHLSHVIDAFENPALPKSADKIDAIKVKKNRRILRLRDAEHSMIIKGFDFSDSIGKQLYRHRLYALDEALGLLLANERGISVPAVLAYGEKRNGLRTLASIVVMEDIQDSFHPVDIFRGDTSHDLTIQNALNRITPLFLQVFHAGCNHIDLHGTSFLFHRSDNKQDKVIDFQFSVFHAQPSANILVHQLAHFYTASIKDIDAHWLNDWALSVLTAAQPEQATSLYEQYQECTRNPITSAYQRMSLKP